MEGLGASVSSFSPGSTVPDHFFPEAFGEKWSASGPPEASEDLLSYLHLSVVKYVVKGAVAHNLGND